MKRLVIVMLVVGLSLSSPLFGSLLDIRNERRQIDNMVLAKYKKVIKDPNTMADSEIIFYADRNSKIRKSYHLSVGADGSGQMVSYYNSKGQIIYVLFNENVSDSYSFQGAMYFKKGRIIRLGSKLFDEWTSAKKILKNNVVLKKQGGNMGYGYYVNYYPTTYSLKVDGKYPKGFKYSGKVRFGVTMNKFTRTLAHGVTLRSLPATSGKKLAVLPAFHPVKPIKLSASKYIGGWGRYPWVKVITYVKGKKYMGWFFGGMITEEEQK